MLLDLNHMLKGRAHTGGMGIGKKPKTWKCLMSPLQRNLHRNFKATEVSMGRGSGTSEKVSLKWVNLGCNTFVHGSNARNLSV
jgi:hypothetical protein